VRLSTPLTGSLMVHYRGSLHSALKDDPTPPPISEFS
jgi:hypothetical protein